MPAKSYQLKKVLENVIPDKMSLEELFLAFYQIAIELERSKEPDINDYYEYPINFKNEKLMVVDLPCNAQFYQLFNDNRDPKKTKWPKDLYIGLSVIVDKKVYRLLNMVIAYEDIVDFNPEEELMPIPIENFELNLKEAAKLEISSEQIEMLNNLIKSIHSFGELQDLLRKNIDDEVKVQKSIFLALSSKSIELSQIYSELNNRRLKDALRNKSSLLVSFLRGHIIENKKVSISTDELIRVTELDQYQLNAVATALNSTVSVITGPPGTGKTQVIENILANALLRGKKVLVASKNNKAVDNVKERFDLIDDTGYFVRFGAKRFIEEKTKPEMDRLASRISTIDKEAAKRNYETLNNKFKSALSEINQALQRIERRRQLSVELPPLQLEIDSKKQIKEQQKEQHEHKRAEIENRYDDIQSAKSITTTSLNEYASNIRKLKNTINDKFTGAFAFWHKWFSKKKYATLLLNTFEDFPYQLKQLALSKGIQTEVSQFDEQEDMNSFSDTILSVISRVQSYHTSISSEQLDFDRNERIINREINQLLDTFNSKKSEHDDLLAEEEENKSIITQNNLWIKNSGLNILHATIQYYLSAARFPESSISRYKSYLSANIWKDSDYQDYESAARKFLRTIRMCSVTSLSSKNAFPLTSELFDMVVIDEASQCDVASAIPLIMRAKQLVVIGDPMQLRHISAVKTKEEDAIREHLGLAKARFLQYAECSLWDYCKSLISQSRSGVKVPVMLQCHYRCHPNIIAYSNTMFYNDKNTGRLEVCTRMDKLKGDPKGIVLVDVVGKQTSDVVNINEVEARKAVEIAIKTASQYPDVSIGIVTPFKHQAERINQLIPNNLLQRIDANTVHKYQGDEKDVMIYSLVVTDNSPDRKIGWIDNIVPNLVNVAVTRAKSTLYVVCNVNYIKAHSPNYKPLGHLVRNN